jgi:hypothetical protein
MNEFLSRRLICRKALCQGNGNVKPRPQGLIRVNFARAVRLPILFLFFVLIVYKLLLLNTACLQRNQQYIILLRNLLPC